MILPKEIQQKANRFKVRDQQIEKDYILSWLLYGISKNSLLSKSLVFKGGTVLKKVYFENYRYSEDLDFTLIGNGSTDDEILKQFEKVFSSIKEEANIPLSIIDTKKNHDGGMNFYITYSGPLGGTGVNKKVKVDIARNEITLFPIKHNSVFINYSDLNEYKLTCYTLDECLIEKLRSTMQRMQARDLYDIWFLLENEDFDLNYLLPEFRQKCEYKGLDINNFKDTLSRRMDQYKGRWRNSLKDQIHDLTDFERVKRETMRHIRSLEI